ncbi:hypothetical protein MXB_1117, partial [Myxobolus squamalis]
MSDCYSQGDIQFFLSNPITKKTENKFFCNICQCSVSSSGDKNESLHIDGKNHQKSLIFYTNLLEQWDRSVHVTGIKSNVLEQEFIDYFNQYGTFKKHFFARDKGGYAIIEYESKLSAEKLLACDQVHIISNCLLNIRKREGKVDKIQEKSKHDSTLIVKKILHEIEDIKTVDQQLSYLYEKIAFQLQPLEIVITELQEFIRRSVPDAELSLFGSHFFSIGFKPSDLDINISTLSSEDCLATLIRIMALMIQSGKFCDKIRLIKSKRCPVLRLRITSLQLSCDITLNNHLALCNNQLLLAYFKLCSFLDKTPNSTLFSVVFLLKVWLYQNHLKGMAFNQMNSYALIIMIIFFFQNQNYLPSLQKPNSLWLKHPLTINNFSSNTIEGWDCCFVNDLTIFHEYFVRPNLITTMKRIFVFYTREFDFNTHVIDIRNGGQFIMTKESCVHELLHLPNKNILQNDLKKFSESSIIVQDPFELSHNITKNITKKGFNHILTIMNSTLNRLDFEETAGLEKIKPSDHNESLLSIILPFDYTSSDFLHKYKIVFSRFIPTSRCEFFKDILSLCLSLFLDRFLSKIEFFCQSDTLAFVSPHEIQSFSHLQELIKNLDYDSTYEFSFQLNTPDSSWYHRRRNSRHHLDTKVECNESISFKLTFTYEIYDQSIH